MISIVVLHHNKAAYSAACLESLLCCTARPLEIVNIDNGSSDETPAVIAAWEGQAHARGIVAKVRRFDENIGAIRGRNEALKLVGGQYIAFLDNDTIVAQANWLERLRDFLDADESRAIVAPKLLFPWEPFAIECCGAGVSARGRIQYIGRGQDRAARTAPAPVQCAISAAWMSRRSLFDEIGELDEVYSPVQYEDLDFCYRARAAGKTVWSMGEVELYHFEHTTTSGSGDINFKYVTTKNGIEFKRRWASTFGTENGPTEAEAQWHSLPKRGIEEIDWRALLK